MINEWQWQFIRWNGRCNPGSCRIPSFEVLTAKKIDKKHSIEISSKFITVLLFYWNSIINDIERFYLSRKKGYTFLQNLYSKFQEFQRAIIILTDLVQN